VQTAFAASQIVGIPLALVLSNRWGWHAPFFLIVAISSPVWVLIARRVRPIDLHLAIRRNESPFRHLFRTISRPEYLRVYACTMLLVTGGFMLMPFGSAYIVNNMKIDIEHLPVIYVVTGLVSIVAGPLVGRLADSIGKYQVFCISSAVAMVMVIIFTRLGPTPLWLVIAVNVLLMVCVTSRIISATALTSIVPDPEDRGSFMAVNSAIQQVSGGVASAAAGLIVERTSSGALRHYDTLGYIVAGSIVVVAVLLYPINRAVALKLSGATGAPSVV
jgi:predicted MFS family arabinose efflux permease